MDGTFSTKYSLIVQSDIIVGKIPKDASHVDKRSVSNYAARQCNKGGKRGQFNYKCR